MKREDYISWDEYFMGVAVLSSMRSKDPSTQVGACIVSPENRIMGVGYNGFPNGCADDQLPWGKDAKDEYDTKYPYVVHAEPNAIINAGRDLKGCRIYVTLFPCSTCTQYIIQSGIREVIYLYEIVKPHYLASMKSAKRMMDLSGVVVRKFGSEKTSLTIIFG